MRGRAGLALFVLILAGLWFVAASPESWQSAAAIRAEQLEQAVHEDDHSAIRSLVANDAVRGVRCRAIHIALRHRNFKIVKLLLEAGVAPNAATEGGRTPLMEAGQFLGSREASVAIARRLLDAGAKVNSIDHIGHTPLDYAIKNDHGEIARLIREAGGQPGIAVR